MRCGEGILLFGAALNITPSTVEQYFFHRWWVEDATSEQQTTIRDRIADGRFEFAVGGWVMPDEAVTDYADLIVAMATGHEFIFDTFGVVPKYGFQVRQGKWRPSTPVAAAFALTRSLPLTRYHEHRLAGGSVRRLDCVRCAQCPDGI